MSPTIGWSATLTDGMAAKLYLEATGLPTIVYPAIEQAIWEGRTLNSTVVVVARADAYFPPGPNQALEVEMDDLERLADDLARERNFSTALDISQKIISLNKNGTAEEKKIFEKSAKMLNII